MKQGCGAHHAGGGWSIFVLDGVAGGDIGSTRECTAVKEGIIA